MCVHQTSFIPSSEYLGTLFCSSHCCHSQQCSVMAFPQVHGASLAFCNRASLPPPHGMPAEPHSAVLAESQTGECEGVDTHRGNLSSLKSRAGESLISSSVSDNSDNSEGQFTQLSKGSQQDQAPCSYSGGWLNNEPLNWLPFFLFTILLQTPTPAPWNHFPK